MLGANSSSQHYISINKNSNETGKSNFIQNNQNIIGNNNISNELYLLYQTPIKPLDQIINNINNNNTTPFYFDFNQHFGNLWSAGKIPNNQLLNQNMNLSPSQLKKSLEKSYKLSPISISSKQKNGNSQDNSNNSNDSNNSKNSGSNFNNNLIINPNNEGRYNSLKMNEIINCGNPLSENNNNNDISKKNLYELFNNCKNEQFLSETQRQNNNIDYVNNFYNNNNKIELIRKKNINLQISPQFMFSSPRNIKKSKKIFECSGSTVATNSSNKNCFKKRRFRKNNEQLLLLKKFYEENKSWSKSQIKEISQKISLKENKVYKWLWDQRNKEIKANKFVVKKGDSE